MFLHNTRLFFRNTLLLFRKNWLRQTRQVKGFLCEMLCPLIIIVLFGLIRLLIPDPFTFDVDYGNDQWMNNPEFFKPNEFSLAHVLKDMVCPDFGSEQPAMVGIIPRPPGTNSVLDQIVNLMETNFDATSQHLSDSGQPENPLFPVQPCHFDNTTQWGHFVKYFDSEEEMIQYTTENSEYSLGSWSHTSTTNNANRPVAFVIVFESTTDVNSISYKIRGNSTWAEPHYPRMPATDPNSDNMPVNRFGRFLETMYQEGMGHYAGSFSRVQAYVDYIIIVLNAQANSQATPVYQFGQFVFPVDSFRADFFFRFVQFALPFLWMIAFLYPYFALISALIEEKSTRIKEGLRMMGASLTQFWLSWYLYAISKYTILAFACAGVGYAMNVVTYSDFFIIFLWFELFLAVIFCSAVLFSAIFENPRTGSMIGIVAWLLMYFSNFFAEGANFNNSQNTALCLLGPTCFALSTRVWGKWEEGLIGVQWDNMHEVVSGLSFRNALVMMFVDCIIYTLLALYLEKVVPSSFGQTHPWYFVMDPNFWFPEYMKKRFGSRRQMEKESMVNISVNNFEKVARDEEPSIVLRNLRKEFNGGLGKPPFTAVKSVTLEMYENQIFCLLGHNGAGKTTTINMLSGMLDVTSGQATILGHDVEAEMPVIRKHLGVCPQHDVLWSDMTVGEHLKFFAALKGVESHLVAAAVKETLEEIGIPEKIDEYPTALSGGQKRKLSLGIALIGGSKVVFLDEPTSGMDPQSRRSAWEVIKKARQGRTIILTTHFMDEADILGDRIAIMAQGQVQCLGSSLFLKKLYGVGYSFVVSLKQGLSAQEAQRGVKQLVHEHVPQAEVVSAHGAELVLRLPFEQAPSFPALFRNLDANMEEFGIGSYGISVTTLEEVFIKVGHGEENDAEEIARMKKRTITSDSDCEEKATEPEQHLERQWSEMLEDVRTRSSRTPWSKHLWAMLYKKLSFARRDQRVLLCQLFCPLLFFVFSFSLTLIVGNNPTPVLSLMTTSPYGGPAGYNVQYNDGPGAAVWNLSYGELENDFGALQALTPSIPNNLKSFQDTLLTAASEEPLNYYAFFTTSNSSVYNISNNSIVEPAWWLGVGSNASATHGFPSAVNLASNWVLNRVVPSAKIRAAIQPLPRTKEEAAQISRDLGQTGALFLGIGGSFFPMAAMYNIVYERETLAKHQLLVSGVNFIAYWLGSYITDVLLVLPLAAFSLVIVAAFNVQVYMGDALGYFFVTILLYSLSIISFTYMFSWLFSNAQKAQYTALGVYILCGFAMPLASVIMDGIPTTQDENKHIKVFYEFLPSYWFSMTMRSIAIREAGSVSAFPPNSALNSWDVTGKSFLYMAVESVGYLLITLLLEYLSTIPGVLAMFGLLPNTQIQREPLDSDVAEEQKRIKALMKSNGTVESKDPVVIAGLRKVYSSQNVVSALLRQAPNARQLNTAVKELYYTVPRGQVFGFLGVNGAGKTTTLSMLSGRFPPSEGSAFINQVSISDQLACRRMLGYCPQFDALFELMTAREHLRVYGLLKGLSEAEIVKQSNELIEKLMLEKYADRAAGTYSGGNKRKLSVAIAMIGNPPIVFLDEPSTGMDPVSRRHMWDYISSTMQGRSVILTTHSMEECEALCHRVGIMVSGQLKCLGTTQHLKSKFGKGYQLDVTVDVENQEQYEGAVVTAFPRTIILEAHDENVKYRIEDVEKMSLADMFEKLESIHESVVKPKSYALNQTSLEQIFIQMAAPVRISREMSELYRALREPQVQQPVQLEGQEEGSSDNHYRIPVQD